MTTAMDTMALARTERADLANLLATLEPAQRKAPSLCTQWRVRDVVAHVFGDDTLSSVALVRRFVAGPSRSGERARWRPYQSGPTHPRPPPCRH